MGLPAIFRGFRKCNYFRTLCIGRHPNEDARARCRTAGIGVRLRSPPQRRRHSGHPCRPQDRSPPAVPGAGPEREARNQATRRVGSRRGPEDHDRTRRGNERAAVLLQRPAWRRCAVECGCHFCDLGGNTEIVFEQKKLDAAAAAKGVSIIPDCGLAPGMVNILAAEGIRRLDTSGAGADLRRRPAAAARAAAQLPDRLLARGRARLLHHALVGPARRQAGTGGRAVRAGARGVPRTGRARSRRSTPPAASARCRSAYEGKVRRHGVQDAPLSRSRRHHAADPGAGPAGGHADRR